MCTQFQISESKEHGITLRIDDIEIADEFDDFLNENCYVLTQMKLASDYVDFYFGQASCIEKVTELVQRFQAK